MTSSGLSWDYRRLYWLLVFSIAHSLVSMGRVSADAVTEANTLMLNAIRSDDTGPPLAARNLAILHVAIFDSFNGIHRGYEQFNAQLSPPVGASAEAAVVSSAYEVLTSLYPSYGPVFDAWFDGNLATMPVQGKIEGVQFGVAVADEILALRQSDGATTTVSYIPRIGPGQWQRTPPFFRPPDFPQWPYVTTFAIPFADMFVPAGPPTLDSAEWVSDFLQVRDIGGRNSAIRTAEQTQIASFWSDFSYTATPCGHWNVIAQSVATDHGNSMGENARLFAMINVAMADAGIVCWKTKYRYNFWRPITAIRLADTDGNASTASDVNWNPYLNTPPFPEYPSGHASFSAAAATVLGSVFGADNISFSVSSDGLPNTIRSYSGFWQAAEECGLSRIYGGIHFPFSDTDGLLIGREVGEYILKNLFHQLPKESSLAIRQLTTNNSVEITVKGTSGAECVVERSTDLVHWTSIITNAAPFVFHASVSTNRVSQFFRAIY